MSALVAFLLTFGAVTAPAAPTRWVEDHAALMTEPARAALDARLSAYERATGHQVVVWTEQTVEGALLADWAARAFAAWRLGRSGKDDGVAIFVLAGDHAIDIEVGHGLEHKIPDATASRIIHDVMAPKLRAHDPDAAIAAGADAILAAIEGRVWAPAMAATAGPAPATWGVGGLGVLVFLLLLVTRPRPARAVRWMLGRGGSGGAGLRGRGGRARDWSATTSRA